MKKVTHLFLPNPPLKVEVLSSPHFLKIWLEAQRPLPHPTPLQKGGGGCPLCVTHVKPQINEKKLYCEKNGAKRAKKPATGENFFLVSIAIFIFNFS